MHMKFMKRSLVATMLWTCLLFTLLPWGTACAAGDEASKVREAVQVLSDITKVPDFEIPEAVLKDAYGIAVIPGVLKAGFMVGGRYGKGVLSVQDDSGSWSDPVFISITGGSLGWQLGVQSTDIILVFKKKRSIEKIAQGKFTLGSDASIAAGPVGRHASAQTDISLKAEIYSYSRNRGFFAGISLEGSVVQINDAANSAFYGKPGITAESIFGGKAGKTPGEAAEFKSGIGNLYARSSGSGGA